MIEYCRLLYLVKESVKWLVEDNSAWGCSDLEMYGQIMLECIFQDEKLGGVDLAHQDSIIIYCYYCIYTIL
jgi:hypothetical protein